MGEAGELAECFQWKGEVPCGLPGFSDAERQHVGAWGHARRPPAAAPLRPAVWACRLLTACRRPSLLHHRAMATASVLCAGEELADVLLYLVRLSDACGIDLAQAAAAKLQKNAGEAVPDAAAAGGCGLKAAANRLHAAGREAPMPFIQAARGFSQPSCELAAVPR